MPLAEVLNRHGQAEFSALCLSGGGVRSGSFGLGVLQGLARAGLLGKFDYLSTVSGGGYIGGWFTAWRFRAHARGEADPSEQLGREVEPEPVTRLRRADQVPRPADRDALRRRLDARRRRCSVTCSSTGWC